ncbi:hypothetical protein ACQFX6_38800 [Streptomyces sp. DSM 41987]|uniref:hypothetical protein n=1 Tax=Streptomyces TaxID=1883 RepID=UPI0036D3D12C
MVLRDGERRSAITVQPPDAVRYADLAVRLKAAGMRRPTRREWDGGLWPMTHCTVTVEADRITQLDTGRLKLACTSSLALSPGWHAAAVHGHVLVSLVEPGTWAQSHAADEGIEDAVLVAAVDAGRLLCGLADIRTVTAPR